MSEELTPEQKKKNAEDEMSTAEKAMSLLRTMGATIRERKAYASPEVVQLRLQVCDNCPTKRKDGDRCTRCTCTIKTKVRYAMSVCPDCHWGCEL